MAGCCAGTAGCRCVLSAAADDGCSPVQIDVAGAGSTAVPFTVGATFDPTRLVRTDGNEPWTIETIAGCDVLVPRCQYDAPDFVFMCVGGNHVGYALLGLDCETGASVPLYQAVDSTSTSTSLPSGWDACCADANSGGFAPMFSDGTDPTTTVGYVFIRYDNETGTYQQRYVTTGGSATNTKPGSWEIGACATSTGGGGGGGTVDTVPGVANFTVASGFVVDGTAYPDWGIPNLTAAQRVITLNMPPGFTDADWTRIVVTIHGATGALTENFTATVRDITNSVDVAALTIASGTAPSSGKIRSAATIGSGAWTDNTDLRLTVACEDNLVGGLQVDVFYAMNPT